MSGFRPAFPELGAGVSQPAPAPGVFVPSLPGPPAGGPGSAYTHTQSSASDAWVVNHNLGYRPAVSVLSVGGKEMLAGVVHTSTNQFVVSFDQPTAGLAVCS